jgi:hypothetical protein
LDFLAIVFPLVVLNLISSSQKAQCFNGMITHVTLGAQRRRNSRSCRVL